MRAGAELGHSAPCDLRPLREENSQLKRLVQNCSEWVHNAPYWSPVALPGICLILSRFPELCLYTDCRRLGDESSVSKPLQQHQECSPSQGALLKTKDGSATKSLPQMSR